ncbi:MAG: 23S rRNA (pseudouridine(1915)-N(3))-methyltransferase RlmH [Lentisphaerae bacterium]|nr:23S rRNA (pseudouridine(1915)-N(3))-methyltransferase RlmH [Lentisphaerota bacterium]
MAKYEKFIKLVAIGKMRDRLFDAKCQEFSSRLNAYGKCETVILPDSNVANEGKAILREVDKERTAMVIALTEEGKEFTTAEFSNVIGQIDRKIVFIIGGPFGLAPEVKQRADMLWSLSKMTFTHEMARMLFYEQVYRALNLLNGGAYHH